MNPTYTFTIIGHYFSGGKVCIDFKIEGKKKNKKYSLCLTAKTPMTEVVNDDVFIQWLLTDYTGLHSAYAHISNQLKDEEEE